MLLVGLVGGGSPTSGSFRKFVLLKPIPVSRPWILTSRRRQPGCYQNLWVSVAGCKGGEDTEEAAACVCLLLFVLDGQEEESPWRGINRKERLFVDDELEVESRTSALEKAGEF